MAALTTSGNEALRSRNDDFSEGLAVPQPEADAPTADDPAFAAAVAALPPVMHRDAYVRWREAAAVRVGELRDAGLVRRHGAPGTPR